MKSDFEKICGLPNFCDSIDATHIVMILSTVGRSNGVWIDSEKNHNMLLQATVDQDMRFCDVMQNSSFRRLSKQVKWLDEKKKNRNSRWNGVGEVHNCGLSLLRHLADEVLDELPSPHQHDSDYLQQISETASKTGIVNLFNKSSCESCDVHGTNQELLV
ncbi:hypothetical protein OIU74_018934 [Salix koriyanagi]|uniref:Uncharacterized protein n=1 Tax=Salix koriyanagi TaxID=2511006 RepID=A0A9Q0WSN2_9ROSI|nr:hypothetical protein OIU74_018934 [Salix koriyanagi]